MADRASCRVADCRDWRIAMLYLLISGPSSSYSISHLLHSGIEQYLWWVAARREIEVLTPPSLQKESRHLEFQSAPREASIESFGDSSFFSCGQALGGHVCCFQTRVRPGRPGQSSDSRFFFLCCHRSKVDWVVAPGIYMQPGHDWKSNTDCCMTAYVEGQGMQ